MKNSSPFSIKKRVQSFRFALKGLVSLFKFEHNSRIHFCTAIAVMIAGFYFKISATEWIMIVFAIGIVFTTELVNSAIENVVDLHSSEISPFAEKAKDYAAAAVLVAALVSVVIGVIIFIPKIFF